MGRHPKPRGHSDREKARITPQPRVEWSLLTLPRRFLEVSRVPHSPGPLSSFFPAPSGSGSGPRSDSLGSSKQMSPVRRNPRSARALSVSDKGLTEKISDGVTPPSTRERIKASSGVRLTLRNSSMDEVLVLSNRFSRLIANIKVSTSSDSLASFMRTSATESRDSEFDSGVSAGVVDWGGGEAVDSFCSGGVAGSSAPSSPSARRNSIAL